MTSVVGDGCTLGVGAFVHYGVRIGDHAVIAPDSFLMKGEEVPPGTLWGGNPAVEMDPERLIHKLAANQRAVAAGAAG